MKAYQFLKTAMFTTGIILTPAALAGDGVVVGVPDDEAPVVEKIKDGKGPLPGTEPAPVIVFPDDTTAPLEDMWPKLYEVLRDRDKDPVNTLIAILKQRHWTPGQLYLITRTAIIANPSIADKIEQILKEGGVSDDVIRVIIDTLREDDAITDGGVHIGEEWPIIPTPDPITTSH